VGEEFESRYTHAFKDICAKLHLTPTNVHGTFVAVVHELFMDGVNWGRIVALVSFGGSVAVECVKKEMPLLVDQVLEWITSFIDTQLSQWIAANGGWVRNYDVFILYIFSRPRCV